TRLTPPSFSSTTPPPPTSTLFPYTTLFRSHIRVNLVIQLYSAFIQQQADAGRGQRDRRGADSKAVLRRHRNAVLEVRTASIPLRSEEHTSELQSLTNLVCRLLLDRKKATRP